MKKDIVHEYLIACLPGYKPEINYQEILNKDGKVTLLGSSVSVQSIFYKVAKQINQSSETSNINQLQSQTQHSTKHQIETIVFAIDFQDP